MSQRWHAIYQEIRRDAAACGFDLSAVGAADAYNADAAPHYALDDFGRSDALTILIGNSRALWPVFLDAVQQSPALGKRSDPLDSWVMDVLGPVFSAIPERHEARFCHEPPPRRVGMQALAQALGLTQTSPSQLSIHPTLGPWIALRAVVVYDVPGPSTAVARPAPCDACNEQPCLGPMKQALELPRPQTDHDVATHWRAWLAVRDACPVGRAARYSDRQVRYHYMKVADLLTDDRG